LESVGYSESPQTPAGDRDIQEEITLRVNCGHLELALRRRRKRPKRQLIKA